MILLQDLHNLVWVVDFVEAQNEGKDCQEGDHSIARFISVEDLLYIAPLPLQTRNDQSLLELWCVVLTYRARINGRYFFVILLKTGNITRTCDGAFSEACLPAIAARG